MAHESETQKFAWQRIGAPLRDDAEMKKHGIGIYNKILPPNASDHYVLIRTDIRDNIDASASNKTVFRETLNQVDLVVSGTMNDNIIDSEGTQRLDLMLAKVRERLDSAGVQYEIRDDDFSDRTNKTRKIITFNNWY